MLISKEEWIKKASELERGMFLKTTQHPFLGRFVEFLHIDQITIMSNPDYQESTDNGVWDNIETLKLDDLFTDIMKNGMRDPMFVGIGLLNSMMRLETGNQRVQTFKRNGINFIPVVAYVGQSQITNLGNGIHEGIKIDLDPNLTKDFMGPYPLKHFDQLSRYVKYK